MMFHNFFSQAIGAMKSLHCTCRLAGPPNLRFCHSSHSLPQNSPFLLLLLLPPRIQLLSLRNSFSHSNFRKPSSAFSSGLVARASMAASTPVTGTETGTKRFSVLFVCLGNICRSPAAEGVFRDLVKKRGLDIKFQIDSAGTINYHEVSVLVFFSLFGCSENKRKITGKWKSVC